MSESRIRIFIGWREWVALPGLGLPAIKAKVDTGAKTSSLHAFNIDPYYDRGRLKVSFQVHPLHEHTDVVVTCTADVVDYRAVSDSGGHREKRYVIKTHLKIGELDYPIEVTLANRESMTHKMLIGRAAMKQLMIDPGRAFLLGRPEKVLRAYRSLATGARPLKAAPKSLLKKKKKKSRI